MDDTRADSPLLARAWATLAGAAHPYLSYTGPQPPDTPEALEALLRAYRSEVLLRYAAWAAASAGPGAAPTQPIPLRYTELRLSLPRPAFDEEDGLPSDEPMFDDLRARLRVWHELALLGPPGVGKTTALWGLAHDMAGDDGAELPIVVELAAQPAEPSLIALLQSALQGATLADADGRVRSLAAHGLVAEQIAGLIASRPVALLWDGLDAVAADRAEAITRALAAVPRTVSGLVSLMTCRSDRYASFSGPGQGKLYAAIKQAAVLPLDVQSVRALVRGRRGEHAEGLLRRIEGPGGARMLARSPLLLSVICELDAAGDAVAGGQGPLLGALVAHRLAAAGGAGTSVVRALAALALALTDQRGRGGAESRGWATERLAAEAPGTSPDDLLALALRAGLLTLAGRGGLRFTHALVQEYLAALALRERLSAEPPTPPLTTRTWPAGWAPTLLMLASIAGPDGPEAAQLRDLLGRCLTPAATLLAADPGGPEPAIAALIAEVALGQIADEGASFPQRAAAGSALGLMGDPRTPADLPAWRGVIARRSTHFGASESYWCWVRPGVYAIGGWRAGQPSAAIALEGLWIARLPISVAQYAAFARAGYAEGAQRWWTPKGWAWRSASGRTAPELWDDPGYRSPGQPIVGVSWYEAVAFCAWLTESLGAALPPGLVVRLPTEAEWEAAAAFDERGRRRPYPWGDEGPTLERAVAGESQLHQPAPVGVCPAGAAACGALDMVGNVEEWCHSTAIGYPEGSHAAALDAPSAGSVQIAPVAPQQIAARGGWWSQRRDQVGCASRFWYYASAAGYTTGFRVALAAPLTGRR